MSIILQAVGVVAIVISIFLAGFYLGMRLSARTLISILSRNGIDAGEIVKALDKADGLLK